MRIPKPLMGAFLLALVGCTAAPLAEAPPTVGVAVRIDVSGRGVQALQHRWTARDVDSFHITLTGGPQPVTLDVPAGKQAAIATFGHLPAGGRYAVTVQAIGHNATTPGSAASQVLNTQVAATAIFDFTEGASHDVEAIATQQVSVVLDSAPFSGSASLDVAATAAAFAAAPGGPTATAVKPVVE